MGKGRGLKYHCCLEGKVSEMGLPWALALKNFEPLNVKWRTVGCFNRQISGS